MSEQQYTIAQLLEQQFDFSDYSTEEKEMVIEETVGMIMEGTMLTLLDSASEEIQEKFGNFIELDPTDEMMMMFLNKHFPNFQTVLINEIKIFKEMGNE